MAAHLLFLLKNTWWSQPLLHHQSSFHGLFVCSYFKSQGETDVQGVQLFCCSGLNNCGDEWNIFWWRDKQTPKACKTETDLHSFRIILSVMVSNMSSFPVIQTVLFCFSHTETFVGSNVILENYREKKTWSAPTSCKSKDRLVCKFHQRLLVVDTKCPRAACILGTDLPLWAKRKKNLKQLLLKGRMKTDIWGQFIFKLGSAQSSEGGRATAGCEEGVLTLDRLNRTHDPLTVSQKHK